jgi:tRNA pseudouridine55 synthase
MHGVLNINKPAGITSHDVVSRVRKALGTRRVGHAGTLDPGATGVLIVCVGQATRLSEYLMGQEKEYRTTLVLGQETTTEDFEGEIVSEKECTHISPEDIEAVLPSFIGEIQQIPPMVSAVHHEGKRLYELARKNIVVEREARTVSVRSIRMLNFTPGEYPRVELDVTCSKGTYIRTLCADIGKALGCGGHMGSLVRTRVGRFELSKSVDLEELKTRAEEGKAGDLLVSLADSIPDMPAVQLKENETVLIRNGVRVPTNVKIYDVLLRFLGPDGNLIAIGRVVGQGDEACLRPEKVFSMEEKDKTNEYG